VSRLLDLGDIHFAYPGRPVLRGVDLTLDAGERIGLTGPNGAGKSSLLLVAVGLLKPTRGRVWALGRVRESEDDFADSRPRCGLVFQDADDQLFCPTVAEDVAFGPLNLGRGRDEAREIVSRTLAMLGLDGFEDRITHKLSGGEKRLVSLATVLAMDPDLLLLDEPTTGLDAATRARLIEILTGLPQAMVIVSHDAEFLQAVGTRQAALQDGRLVSA